MLGDRYVVVRGDNLWRIAAKTLGGGKQWPRIWRYNNRAGVVRITGRSIANPDLIYVGQVLLIPRLPTERTSSTATDQEAMSHLPSAAPSTAIGVPAHAPKPRSHEVDPLPHKRTLSDRLRQLRSPLSFKYRLDARWPAQDVGTAVLEVRMTGDFVLMTKKAYPATFVTNRGEIEHQMTNAANHAFGKLVSDNRFIFDPGQKRLTYRSMLVSQSTTPNTVATAVGVEMSSNAPVPKLRAEIRIPKLEGAIDAFHYIALDNKLVVEITPKPQPPGPTRSHELDPVKTPTLESQWVRILGAGLVITTGVLIIAALADEWIPVVGQADDAIALMAAGIMLSRGLSMLGGTHANLPSAAMPVHLEAKATVSGPPSK